MIRRPPRSTRTDTLFPYTTLFRSSAADERADLATRPEQALIYRLSGDYNPLHADPAVAAAAGLDRPILHGLCTYGIAGRALLAALCGNDPAPLARLDCRFTAPVFPGDRLELALWRGAPGEASFQVRPPQRNTRSEARRVRTEGCSTFRFWGSQ